MVLFLIALTLAHAETTLRVPIFIASNGVRLPVRALNDKLQEEGNPLRVPEWIEVDNVNVARGRLSVIDAKIEVAANVVGGEFQDAARAAEFAPGDLKAPGIETCYDGEPSEVGDLAVALGSLLYSEHFSLWGWRYRKQNVLFEMSDGTRAYLERNSPSLWRKRLTDDSIILLSRVTADGQDIHVSQIKKCP